MSSEDALKRHLALAVRRAREVATGEIERIEISYQPSGQYPYRIWETDETYPLAGVASEEDLPDAIAPTASGVALDEDREV